MLPFDCDLLSPVASETRAAIGTRRRETIASGFEICTNA
jgi:hypothetical protein